MSASAGNPPVRGRWRVGSAVLAVAGMLMGGIVATGIFFGWSSLLTPFTGHMPTWASALLLLPQSLAYAWPLIAADSVAVALAVTLSTAVHEGGHVVIGWLVGFRFHSCMIRPVLIARTPRGPRLKLKLRRSPRSYAKLLPTTDRWFRARYTAFLAGGPVFSLLLAVLAWQVAASQGGHIASVGAELGHAYVAWTRPWLHSGPRESAYAAAMGILIADSWFLYVAWAALLTCVGTAVPRQWRGLPSDGMQVVGTWRNGPAFERRQLLSALMGFAQIGERPRHWPTPVIHRALALAETPTEEYLARVFAYFWALDRAEIETAGAHLDRVLALGDSLSPPSATYALEAAYFMARHRQDVVRARGWLDRGAKTSHERFTRPRAEAAIALLENRYQDARDAADAGLAALAAMRRTLTVETHLDEESLRNMAAEARATLAQTAAR